MNFIRRFFLHSVDTSSPSMQAQIETSIDQVHDDVEVLEPYGLTSSPPEEIEEGLSAHVQGHADHGVILGFFDKVFRPQGLSRGQVVIYNKWGVKIELFNGSIKSTANSYQVEAPVSDFSGNVNIQTGATGSITTPTGQVVTFVNGICTSIVG